MTTQPDLRSRIYVATGNMGKVRELHALFAGAPYDLELYPRYRSPPEGIHRYTDNAALKARALAAVLRAEGRSGSVLADDSGLEVAALDGRPGVLTADYGGVDASWPERRRKLLHELASTPAAERGARFVCAMHYVADDGRECGSWGTVDGAIARAEHGTLGFSFDPIFLYAPAGLTFAQLTDSEKNRVSHRAIAVAGLMAAIAAMSVGLPALRGETGRERE